jgi:transcriptional regulator ATRX
MGLGKTLQTITLLHTVIRYPQLKTHKVMVICPKSTIINWSDEIHKWLGPIKSGHKLKVFYFPDNSDIREKMRILHEWSLSSKDKNGCMLIGYEAFRSLVQFETRERKKNQHGILDSVKAVQQKLDNYLLNSADLLICDEGHIIKNPRSAITKAVGRIKTKKRIILTGTPIQNNLKECKNWMLMCISDNLYFSLSFFSDYCMVEFIKPSFLGTEKEFNNLYVNPIK